MPHDLMIQTKSGDVYLRPFCTRKLAKEINAVMFSNVDLDSKGNATGLSLKQVDDSNDVAVLGSIEKILVEGKQIEVTQAFIDNMSTEDFEKVLKEVNKILKRENPKA